LAALEQPSGRDAYNSSGYNGQVAALFKGTQPGENLEVRDFIAAMPGRARSKAKPIIDSISYYANLLKAVSQTGLDWRNFVNYFVYKPYGMNVALAGTALDAPRLAWAEQKDLLLTAVAQTVPTVLDDLGAPLFNKIFNAVRPIDPRLPSQAVVTPLSLISASNSAAATPRAQALFTAGDIKLDYKTNKWFADPASIQRSAAKTLASGLSLIDATVASSSARALMATPSLFGQSLLSEGLRNSAASLLRDLAPLAQIQDGVFSMPLQLPAQSQTLSAEQRMGLYADKGLHRVGDGGFIDATSAAFSLRQFQDRQGATAPFSLTLFVTSTIDPVTGIRMPNGPTAADLSSFRVNGDIAKLFGNLGGTRNDGPTIPTDVISGYAPQVPSPKIFDISAWYNESPEWTYSKGSIDLAYFDLNVTTVDNPSFGIKAGQPGRLQLFTVNNNQSSSAPVTPGILDEYAENFTVVRDAIANQGGSARSAKPRFCRRRSPWSERRCSSAALEPAF